MKKYKSNSNSKCLEKFDFDLLESFVKNQVQLHQRTNILEGIDRIINLECSSHSNIFNLNEGKDFNLGIIGGGFRTSSPNLLHFYHIHPEGSNYLFYFQLQATDSSRIRWIINQQQQEFCFLRCVNNSIQKEAVIQVIFQYLLFCLFLVFVSFLFTLLFTQLDCYG